MDLFIARDDISCDHLGSRSAEEPAVSETQEIARYYGLCHWSTCLKQRICRPKNATSSSMREIERSTSFNNTFAAMGSFARKFEH